MNPLHSVLLASLLFAAAWADTHYVDLAGGNIAPYTSPATAAQDPADAIQAAAPGDLVEIADGVYPVPAQLDVTRLTLQGASTNAVLSGSGSTRVVVGTGCSLFNLTIENGSAIATRGAGAAVTNAVVTGCLFQDNQLQTGAGGGFGQFSSISGAGLYAEDSRVSESLFRRNGHQSLPGCHLPHVQGGGAFFRRCEVRDCRFFNNQCDDGSAFWAAEETMVVNCQASRNRKHLGHPVVLDESTLLHSVIRENTWGVWAKNQSQVIDCEIIDNVGDFGGYAFACVEKSPGGAGLLLQDRSLARRCRISGNSCGFGAGVMIERSQAGPPILQNCLITGNILQNEEFQTGTGAGILFADHAIIEHCTFADNVSTGPGTVIESLMFGSSLDDIVFRNTIVWGNQGVSLANGLPTANFLANILQGTNLTGNLSVDPLLKPNFRLAFNSPAINSGDSTSPPPGLTIFGFPRVLSGATDIGADEYHPDFLITEIDEIGNDEAELTFNTLTGINYQAEFSPTLIPAATWTDAGPLVTGGAGPNSAVVLPTPGLRGVFRVRIVP